MLCPPAGHAKEALSLAQMQEQTLQLEQQSKLKASRGCAVAAGGSVGGFRPPHTWQGR